MVRLPSYPDAALLLVRLALGTVFIVHGWPKISTPSTAIGMAAKLGYEPAALFGIALAAIEFGGGLLLLLGLATRVAALLIASTQIVAVKEVHWRCGYLGTEGCRGFELNFILLCGLAALMLAEAGAYALDRALTGPRRARPADVSPATPRRL